MADLVEEVLKQAAEKTAKYKTTNVEKNLELDLDLGNLLAIDNNPIDLKCYRSNTAEYLDNLARDNTQILLNKVWELPIERFEDVIVAKLPEPTTLLPREKRIPQAKPPTKWEQYAKEKGIQKRKKEKLVWDDVVKEWKPRFGYRRQQNEDAKDWLIEVKETDDPYKDQFAEKLEQKKERVAKNELQRLRNIARARNVKVPGVGLTPTENPSKNQVGKAIALAYKSTASLGKFTQTLANEKPHKMPGNKRKFEPLLGDMKNEKNKNMAILDNISTKKPKLDVNKAINKEVFNEQMQNQEAKQEGNPRAGGKKKGKNQAPRKKGKGGKNHGFKQGGKMGGFRPGGKGKMKMRGKGRR